MSADGQNGADPRGWSLGLDTATPATVAAAVGPDDAAAARAVAPAAGERPGHTRLLLDLAGEVLAATGGSFRAVDRIVVGLGPGTFTGIRVGVATARALALAHGARVVGVPTPWALAEAARTADAAEAGPVLVVQDARRRELFLTLFPATADAGDAPTPFTARRDELAAALARLGTRPAVAVGDGALAFAAVLRDAGVAVSDDPAAHAVDGLALLRAAAGRRGVDPVATPDAVRPVYVRDADAVPTADRR